MACKTGKVSHNGKVGACIAAKKFKDNSLNVYKCMSCNGWHVGHSNDPLRKVGRMNQLFARIKRDDEKRADGSK